MLTVLLAAYLWCVVLYEMSSSVPLSCPAGSDDEDSDEDDSDSDYTSSEEEGEEGEGALDDTVCPPGCDEALFSLACELREKRLDLEDALAEEKKQLEMTKKEMESLKKKAKVMEAGVKTAHSEMQAFQVRCILSW